MGKCRIAAGMLLAGLAWNTYAAQPSQASQPDDDAPPAPLKVLVLPSDIKIYIISVSSMDEDPDLSARMTARADASLHQALTHSSDFTLSDMPALSADEQATLKEHVALYRLEATDAEVLDQTGGDWKRVLENFDYTLGPGLRFLKQRSGADYGLVVFGGDGESTSGNAFKTFMIGGVTGRNYLFAGLIDLETGNIVWLHRDTHDHSNFTTKDNMDVFIMDLLKDYPDGSLHDSSATQ